MRLVVIGLVVILPVLLFSQQTNCVNKQIEDSTLSSISIDFVYYGKTEKFSDLLEYAGQFFPELNGCKIEVRRKKITTMMAARPKRNFLFRQRDDRHYVLLITDKYSMNADSIYNQMSSCAITGVFGHELSHIVSYTQKSGSGMLFFGFKYLFNKKQIETETDLIAIEHGFGAGLIEYTHYIHQSPFTNKKYLSRKKKYYLSAKELEENVQEKL